MNEVNLQALANQATSLQSHRGGTGEVRYVERRSRTTRRRAADRTVRARRHAGRARVVSRQSAPVDRPVFQVAIVDVDTRRWSSPRRPRTAGDVPATVDGDGAIECRFDRLPLRPRQYVLRLAITDAHQLASYDVVTAGPRFAVTGHGGGVDSLADEEDGLVSLPYEFVHRPDVASRHRRERTAPCSCRFRTAAPPATCCAPGICRAGCSMPIGRCSVVLLSPLVEGPGVRARVRASARRRSRICRRTGRQASRRGCWRLMQAGYLESGVTESVQIRRAEAHRQRASIRWLRAEARCWPRRWRRRWCGRRPATTSSIGWSRILRAERCSIATSRRCWSSSSPGLIFSEVPLLRTAARRGVRTHGGRSRAGTTSPTS